MPDTDSDASDVGAHRLRRLVARATGVAPMLYIPPLVGDSTAYLCTHTCPCGAALTCTDCTRSSKTAMHSIKWGCMGPQALGAGYKIEAYRHFSPHEAQYSVHHPRWPESRGPVCVICPWYVNLLDSGNFGLADAQVNARRDLICHHARCCRQIVKR